MIQTLEVQQKIALIRQKILDGTATLDEIKEGVRILREGRTQALEQSATARRKKAIVEIPSADDLLADFMK